MNTPEIRRAGTRGALRNGWLDARFSFSFADYDDPTRRRFGPLLALNEDRVQPATGFPMHPHRDLEIVMLPLSGEVEHHDDLGGHALVRPGQWQWMRAGTGIRHRQWNPSPRAADHHLRIWLEPRVRGLAPKAVVFPIEPAAEGNWQVLVAPQRKAGAQDLGVDVTLSIGVAGPHGVLSCDAHAGGRYLHVIDGIAEASLDGRVVALLEAGDALVFFDDAPRISLKATDRGRLLRFDTGGVDRVTGRLVDLS